MENSILEQYEQLKELLGSVKKDISELVKETIEAEK
jgi:hypothetical protein